MRWTNNQSDYGVIAISLHWISAIAIYGLFALGLWMVELSYYDAWYNEAPAIHKSVGMVLLLLAIGRWLWRLLNPKPEPVGTARERILARTVHRSMYLLLFATLISGYLIPTANGRPIDVFGLVSIPATLTGLPHQEDSAGLAHLWLAWILVIVACGHTLAALKHHFVDKDVTLRRMFTTHTQLTDPQPEKGD